MNAIQIFNYNDAPVSFKDENGISFVNATEMAGNFGKIPANWLRTEQSRKIIEAISTSHKCELADLLMVVNGGDNRGTWMHEDVALVFAQWLSPEFYLWCNDRIKEIAKHGFTATDATLEKMLSNPDLIIGLATQLKAERKKTALLEICNEENQKTISEQAPKVLFASAVEASEQSCLIRNLATILNQNGYIIGQNRLFEILRAEGYLCSRGESYNLPTQKAMDMGLFEVKKTTIQRGGATPLVTTTTKVTGKGQIYFVNHFLRAIA